jgi:protein CpxP
MKKLLFAAGITVLGLTAVFAQDKKQTPAQVSQAQEKKPRTASAGRAAPEKIAEIKTNRLDRQVSLNEDQKKKVYDIYLKEAQAAQGRAAQHDETEVQLKTILTADQHQKYETVKAEKKQQLLERRSEKQSEQKPAPANKEIAE